MQQPTPSEGTSALLTRLAQRPGVQSTLILARNTGSIVKSSGLLTAEDVAVTDSSTPNGAYTNNNAADGEVRNKQGTRAADDVARLVWNFARAAGDMVQELNGEADEAKLLRVRTKKNEIMIVGEGQFLLVVVHDTPPA